MSAREPFGRAVFERLDRKLGLLSNDPRIADIRVRESIAAARRQLRKAFERNEARAARLASLGSGKSSSRRSRETVSA
jgi:hypothetical protein